MNQSRMFLFSSLEAPLRNGDVEQVVVDHTVIYATLRQVLSNMRLSPSQHLVLSGKQLGSLVLVLFSFYIGVQCNE